jgi:glutamate-1-semialdehyde aminotransferase/spore coat polysaccharide biosynthesis protein SpsF (cytidylyltransferase family)
MKNIVVLVQARMGSNRLPAKIIKKVNGKELLIHQVERILNAKTINEVVVITTTKSEDDIIYELCRSYSINCFRGSENDLLDRHYQAAKHYKADFVVKIPSDSPLTDSDIIDDVLSLWINNPKKYDYVSNYHPPTFPDGLDVEGCPIEILEVAWKNATKNHEREHTFPYIWDNPNQFSIGNIINKHGNMFTSYRWTLDYLEDYYFIKSIFENFKNNPNFKMKDVLEYLNENPDIKRINEMHNGVNWYRNVGELKTVDRFQYKREDKPLDLKKSLRLLKTAKKYIPCGTQTLSKGYTQWSVGASPLFIESGKGCEVSDPDGNVFIDYGMGLGPFILGYSDDDVNQAIKNQLEKGTMFTLPSKLEAEASKKIIDCVPCAEMVRFGKNGSDATSAAVKLARAVTKKDLIIHCGYHGWQDWYITSTERDAGIPKVMKKLVISLQYNDIEGLEKIIETHKGKIAGLIMEPVGAVKPKCMNIANCNKLECNSICQNNFLHAVRRITSENNIVLIFDELFTGFRWGMGGASEYFNVVPDLACFGKALSNGMPVSCITGKRKIMEMFEEVFFSFSYGGETLSLAAIIATLDKLRKNKVHEHIETEANLLINGISKLISKHNLEKFISIFGYPFKSVFKLSGNKDFNPLELKTFIQQECAKRGILFIGYHLVSYSHKREHIEFTLEVYDEVFSIVKNALENQNLVQKLEGEVVTQIFKNVGDRSVRN